MCFRRMRLVISRFWLFILQADVQFVPKGYALVNDDDAFVFSILIQPLNPLSDVAERLDTFLETEEFLQSLRSRLDDEMAEFHVLDDALFRPVDLGYNDGISVLGLFCLPLTLLTV